MANNSLLLFKYKTQFANLNVNKSRGRIAPHKPVLLLTIIDLFASEQITDNHIFLNDQLVEHFNHVWKQWVRTSSTFNPDISKPYFHMQGEPFWRLLTHEESLRMNAMVAESHIEDYVAKPLPGYSITAMRENFAFACIDEELFALLQDEEARIELKDVLIGYFTDRHKKYFNLLAASLLSLAIA